jgi:hypothetical protein
MTCQHVARQPTITRVRLRDNLYTISLPSNVLVVGGTSGSARNLSGEPLGTSALKEGADVAVGE